MTSHRNKRVTRRLGALRRKNGRGRCWICGSGSGIKTSREGYGTRCVKCIRLRRSNDDVEEYKRLLLLAKKARD